MKEEKEQNIHIKNKRAYFDFLIDDKFVAGIKLLGTEIKSIRQEKLYERTCKVLPFMGYNAHFFCGDGSNGIPEHAPFDKILVTAGAPFIPEILLKQLKIGGLLVIPVGDEKSQLMTTILRVSEKDYEKVSLDTFRFVPLVGDQAWS